MTPQTIKENWTALNERVQQLCLQAGRPADSVTVIGVSKYVDLAATQQLFDAGCINLGESRPQQIWHKAAELQTSNIHWHLIGHLQRNKVKRTLPFVHTLHSLDSLALAESISDTACQLNKRIKCFIEVNIAGEQAKTGLSFAETTHLVPDMLKLAGIELVGFMGMASHTDDEQFVRDQFLSLKMLRDELQARFADANAPLNQLSMGMSGDFPIAIACGATHIRVGSLLFA